MNRKILLILLTCLILPYSLWAQDNNKFSPAKFEADMRAFITTHAHLTEQEADVFFPLLKEMHEKQREIYGRMTQGRKRPTDEKGFAEALRQQDRSNVELRQLEEKYHQKMLKVLPASKVYDAVQAESRFHRQAMRTWQRPIRQMGRPMGRRK
jgi:hypothetical protein